MLKQTNRNSATIKRLAELAKELEAIDLSPSTSELQCPTSLIASLNTYVSEQSKHTSSADCAELRIAISKILTNKYFRTFNPETEITITAGATQAIFCAIASTVGEGDEVILLEPSHKDYTDAIALTGARATYLQLKNDESIDWNEIPKAITSSTKLIIVGSPHSPTGSVLTIEDWETLQKLIIGTKIKVISDESLTDIIYPHTISSSVAFFPRLSDSSFIVSSLSKSLCADNFKVGYCIAPAGMTTNFRRVLEVVANPLSCPVQLAFADYLNNHGTKPLFPHLELLEKNRNTVRAGLAETKFKLSPLNGGYLQIIDYSEYSKGSDLEFAEMLIRKYGVSAAPISLFHHDNHNRTQIVINIATSSHKLNMAIERLKEVAG